MLGLTVQSSCTVAHKGHRLKESKTKKNKIPTQVNILTTQVNIRYRK